MTKLLDNSTSSSSSSTTTTTATTTILLLPLPLVPVQVPVYNFWGQYLLLQLLVVVVMVAAPAASSAPAVSSAPAAYCSYYCYCCCHSCLRLRLLILLLLPILLTILLLLLRLRLRLLRLLLRRLARHAWHQHMDWSCCKLKRVYELWRLVRWSWWLRSAEGPGTKTLKPSKPWSLNTSRAESQELYFQFAIIRCVFQGLGFCASRMAATATAWQQRTGD